MSAEIDAAIGPPGRDRVAGTPMDGAHVAEKEVKKHPLWEIVAYWGPAILVVLLIRTFVFEPFRIPSGSMSPSLMIGDHVVVTKYSYGLYMPKGIFGLPPSKRIELVDLGSPDRGDIIVFDYPVSPGQAYIKRVVGLPGDRIAVRDNQVILNGVPWPRTLKGSYTDYNARGHSRETRLYTEDIPREDGTTLTHPMLTNKAMPGHLSNKDEITVPAGHVMVMGDNRDNSEDSRAWGFVREDQIFGKAQFIILSTGHKGDPGLRTDRVFMSLHDADAVFDHIHRPK